MVSSPFRNEFTRPVAGKSGNPLLIRQCSVSRSAAERVSFRAPFLVAIFEILERNIRARIGPGQAAFRALQKRRRSTAASCVPRKQACRPPAPFRELISGTIVEVSKPGSSSQMTDCEGLAAPFAVNFSWSKVSTLRISGRSMCRYFEFAKPLGNVNAQRAIKRRFLACFRPHEQTCRSRFPRNGSLMLPQKFGCETP